MPNLEFVFVHIFSKSHKFDVQVFKEQKKRGGGHSLQSWKSMNKKVKVEWVTQLEHVRHSQISTTNGKKSTKLLYL